MPNERLRFNPLAEAELHDAAAWYEERLPGLGLRFLEAVRRRLDEIVAAPARWPVAYGARRLLMGRYPYAIIYRQLANEELEIIAIAHLRRGARYWKSR